MTDEVGVLTMFSVNAGTLFRGASLSRIGHDTQSVCLSVCHTCFRQIVSLGGKAGLS